MKTKTLIIALALSALVLCSCGGQSLSAKESVAVECANNLKSTLVSQTSLELTGNVLYETYQATTDKEELISRDDNGTTYRDYIIIPYAASNKMGVMIDNYAFYYIQMNEDGTYRYKYLGDRGDFESALDDDNYYGIRMYRTDYDIIHSYAQEEIPADIIAKEVGCSVRQ